MKLEVSSRIYLQVGSGEIVGLLGRNGSGKSTLLAAAADRREARDVFVRLDERPLGAAGKMRLIALAPQFSFAPRGLKVRRVFDDHGVDMEEFLREFDEMKFDRRARMGQLSGGERKLIEGYVVARSRQPFCLLDEPFASLMPLSVEKLQRVIQSEAQAGKGFVIADHLMDHYQNMYDRLVRL